jgi:proline iminopeptidase
VSGPAHPPGDHVGVNGHRLWVEREGRGDPLLVLGEIDPAGSHVGFHPWFSAIGAGYEVIYVDLWGRGRSDSPADPRDVTFAGDVADVVALIDELRVAPVHAYGFGYGGLIALEIACSRPAAFRSLTLASCPISREMWLRSQQNLKRELANQRPELWDNVESDGSAGSRSPKRAVAELQLERRSRFYDPSKADLLVTEPRDHNGELQEFLVNRDNDPLGAAALMQVPDFRTRLARLSVPLLVLAGRHDRALPPAEQRQFLVHARSAELRYLEQSGAYPHVEEPQAVRDHVRAFHTTRRVMEHLLDFHGAV